MAQDVGRPTLERLVEHFMPVEASEIESAFDKIWQDASSGALDTSSVRLRVSNVVVWGMEAEAAARFEHVMESLARRHPCRGILAVFGSPVAGLQSEISAHCWRTASGGRHICSEEILLRAVAGMERELASAVLALLIPELPVHLWLIGEPDPLRRVPDEVLDAVDRLYVDSAGGTLVPVSLSTIQRALSSDDIHLVDLAWQRTAPWRDAVAQLFDGHALPLLDQITSIEIAGGAGNASSAALLVAGWLLSRLDLAAASVEATNTLVTGTYYDGSRAIALRIMPSETGAELDLLQLHTADASMGVTLDTDSGHMHVRSDWPADPVQRTVAMDGTDDTAVLTAALEDQAAPGLYDSALRAALELIA